MFDWLFSKEPVLQFEDFDLDGSEDSDDESHSDDSKESNEQSPPKVNIVTKARDWFISTSAAVSYYLSSDPDKEQKRDILRNIASHIVTAHVPTAEDPESYFVISGDEIIFNPVIFSGDAVPGSGACLKDLFSHFQNSGMKVIGSKIAFDENPNLELIEKLLANDLELARICYEQRLMALKCDGCLGTQSENEKLKFKLRLDNHGNLLVGFDEGNDKYTYQYMRFIVSSMDDEYKVSIEGEAFLKIDAIKENSSDGDNAFVQKLRDAYGHNRDFFFNDLFYLNENPLLPANEEEERSNYYLPRIEKLIEAVEQIDHGLIRSVLGPIKGSAFDNDQVSIREGLLRGALGSYRNSSNPISNKRVPEFQLSKCTLEELRYLLHDLQWYATRKRKHQFSPETDEKLKKLPEGQTKESILNTCNGKVVGNFDLFRLNQLEGIHFETYRKNLIGILEFRLAQLNDEYQEMEHVNTQLNDKKSRTHIRENHYHEQMLSKLSQIPVLGLVVKVAVFFSKANKLFSAAKNWFFPPQISNDKPDLAHVKQPMERNRKRYSVLSGFKNKLESYGFAQGKKQVTSADICEWYDEAYQLGLQMDLDSKAEQLQRSKSLVAASQKNTTQPVAYVEKACKKELPSPERYAKYDGIKKWVHHVSQLSLSPITKSEAQQQSNNQTSYEDVRKCFGNIDTTINKYDECMASSCYQDDREKFKAQNKIYLEEQIVRPELNDGWSLINGSIYRASIVRNGDSVTYRIKRKSDEVVKCTYSKSMNSEYQYDKRSKEETYYAITIPIDLLKNLIQEFRGEEIDFDKVARYKPYLPEVLEIAFLGNEKLSISRLKREDGGLYENSLVEGESVKNIEINPNALKKRDEFISTLKEVNRFNKNNGNTSQASRSSMLLFQNQRDSSVAPQQNAQLQMIDSQRSAKLEEKLSTWQRDIFHNIYTQRNWFSTFFKVSTKSSKAYLKEVHNPQVNKLKQNTPAGAA